MRLPLRDGASLGVELIHDGFELIELRGCWMVRWLFFDSQAVEGVTVTELSPVSEIRLSPRSGGKA